MKLSWPTPTPDPSTHPFATGARPRRPRRRTLLSESLPPGRRQPAGLLCTALLVGALLTPGRAGADEAEQYWPQWRGPQATGVAPESDPPVEWSEEKNVRWKVEVPGKGHATPIIWKDKVFLTTAVPTEQRAAEPEPEPADGDQRRPGGIQPTHAQRFVVLALDRATGKVVWERTALEALPHEGTHHDGTWASPSPVTDGERLFAHFGSNGLYAYDLAGSLLWSKDLGDMQTRNGFGEGSSPVVHGDTLVVNWDHEGDSFIVALDKRTGKELWRRERDEVTSWSTPLVVERGPRPLVVVAATGKTRGYDLATGDVVWESAGMTVNTIPSPVERDGTVYVMSGFRGNALQAIRLEGARGDLEGSPAISWTFDRDTPYVPSPLLYGDGLYFLKHNRAILSLLDADTGEVRYGPERLEGLEGVYASPVGAAGRVYIAGRNGAVAVLAHGPELKVLATNQLDETFDASPAVAGDELYLRGQRHLYCIAEGAKAEAPREEASGR